VLGRDPGFIHLSDDIGARRFHIPKHIQAKMTLDEVWAANRKFLDRTILRGDDIVLSTPAHLAEKGTFFARELDYLLNVRKAYRLSDDGLCLIRLAD
jgi:hypothetical protein